MSGMGKHKSLYELIGSLEWILVKKEFDIMSRAKGCYEIFYPEVVKDRDKDSPQRLHFRGRIKKEPDQENDRDTGEGESKRAKGDSNEEDSTEMLIKQYRKEIERIQRISEPSVQAVEYQILAMTMDHAKNKEKKREREEKESKDKSEKAYELLFAHIGPTTRDYISDELSVGDIAGAWQKLDEKYQKSLQIDGPVAVEALNFYKIKKNQSIDEFEKGLRFLFKLNEIVRGNRISDMERLIYLKNGLKEDKRFADYIKISNYVKDGYDQCLENIRNENNRIELEKIINMSIKDSIQDNKMFNLEDKKKNNAPAAQSYLASDGDPSPVKEPLKCWICGSTQHLKDKCPVHRAKQGTEDSGEKTKSPAKEAARTAKSINNRYKMAEAETNHVRCLWSSGEESD